MKFSNIGDYYKAILKINAKGKDFGISRWNPVLLCVPCVSLAVTQIAQIRDRDLELPQHTLLKYLNKSLDF